MSGLVTRILILAGTTGALALPVVLSLQAESEAEVIPAASPAVSLPGPEQPEGQGEGAPILRSDSLPPSDTGFPRDRISDMRARLDPQGSAEEPATGH